MPYWLTSSEHRLRTDWMKRFDPRYWTVNFPRPSMASVVSTGPAALRVDAVFYQRQDLIGLIWESEDRFDHPLLGYETSRDYRGLTLSFRWRASGDLKRLDAVYGPTLTLEGRDSQGTPRTWYVRLWNYASGTPEDAVIHLDFDDMSGGFLLPSEADPVWAGDIDRLFISLVPSSFDGSSAPLASPASATIEISDILCEGGDATLPLGDAFLPPHDLRLASGYDDSYHLTPARVLRGALHLGYRAWIDHYVGMSHYAALGYQPADGRFIAGGGGAVLNAPCQSWHRDFLSRAQALDYRVILSLSYELFDAYTPEDWKQRSFDGAPALTGWSPPSTLLSPAHSGAMAYLQRVAHDFVALQVEAGMAATFQIGEPWWWSGFGEIRKPCFYDAATRSAYTAATGKSVPPMHQSATETISPEQGDYLDWLGNVLGASTLALRDHVRSAFPGAWVGLLFFTPQVIDPAAPLLARANLPRQWMYPAFDVLQVEDYDHVTSGQDAARAQALGLVDAHLKYPRSAMNYFSGFVLNAADRRFWKRIIQAAQNAQEAGFAQVFLWAYPQIARDGLTYFSLKEDEGIMGFHDVQFPLEVGFGASGGSEFSTTVVATASGFEQRNINWSQARLRYDAGLGVRSEQDIAVLTAFFRARRGRAYAFRFRDLWDDRSASVGSAVTAFDQPLGMGDGAATQFQLVKRYGDETDALVRPITRPVMGSIRVSINGAEVSQGWTCDPSTGIVAFSTPPAPGAELRAGFLFDVPVRFADDHLPISLASFQAGEVPSIPLVEVREK